MGTISKPEGTSVLPVSVPGATTNNTTKTYASMKDLIALKDTLSLYNKIYEDNIVIASKSPLYKLLHVDSLTNLIKIQSEIDTNTIVDNYELVNSERRKYENAIKNIRQGVLPEVLKTDTPSSDNTRHNDELSLSDITGAIKRANDEQTRVDLLRVQSDDILQRSKTLERVRLDLEDIVRRITKGDLKISDVPFTKRELNKFLIDVSDHGSHIAPIPSIIGLDIVETETTKPKTIEENNGIDFIKSITSDLAWDINVSYDPNITINKKILKQLDLLSRQITSGRLSPEEMGSKKLELEILNQQSKALNQRLSTNSLNSLTPVDTNKYSGAFSESNLLSEIPAMGTYERPDKDKLSKSNNELVGSNDWLKRPGYEQNTETISKRGSSSNFDASVSSPDYKKRALFLCSQIRDAGLGNPHDFGCINNPEIDVNADYSWKGNYKMVCKRLGNIWGGWYPEMFGCPKDDIAFSQRIVQKIQDE